MLDTRALIDRTHPFDALDSAERSRIIEALTPAHFSPGQTILKRWDKPDSLFLVADGSVEEVDAAGPIGNFGVGDCFDARGLLRGRTETAFVSRDSSLCYLLPAALFQALTRNDAPFRAYFEEDLARRQQAIVTIQQQREAAAFLLGRLGDRPLKAPIILPADATLGDAARAMDDNGTSAVLVGSPPDLTLFTRGDVREKRRQLGLIDAIPLRAIAHRPAVTLDHNSFLFNALVAMIQNDTAQILVTAGNRLIGLFEQADLLASMSNVSFMIADQVDRATTADELRDASLAVPQLIKALYERGVKPRIIAQAVAELNGKLMKRLYERIMPAAMHHEACLMVLGSEGRNEQLLRTDQDNAMIFREEPPAEAPEWTSAYSDALAALGYPPCPGNVMVSNPAWAKSYAAFSRNIKDWVYSPDMAALLNLAIFFDARAVAGDTTLLSQIKVYLFDVLRRGDVPLGYFAKATLNFDTPVGFLGRFVTERSGKHAGAFDIKKGAVFPIVHGIRSLALEQGLMETSTIDRIQAMSGRSPLGQSFIGDLIETFDFLTLVRLREQLRKWETAEPYDNYVRPAALSKLDRNLLRDALKIVDEFKSYISSHFRLHMVS